MNKLEFKEVMTVLAIPQISSQKELYSWHGIQFAFADGSDYSIVEGKIPYLVAQKITDKYPDNPYAIRVAGHCNCNTKPIDWATCENYDEIINILAIRGHEKEIISAFPEKFYIECYHIDTKEGLVVLITELQDYFLKKLTNIDNDDVQFQVARQSEILNTINNIVIEKCHLNLSVNQWLSKNNLTELQTARNILNTNEQDNKIRTLLNGFDASVNLFANSYHGQLDPMKVLFTCYPYENEDVYVSIVDKLSKHKVEYTRQDKGYFSLAFCSKNPGLIIKHEYYAGSTNNPQTELVYLYKKCPNTNEYYLAYNLINGLVHTEDFGECSPITNKQKLLLIQGLKEALSKSREVTINNLKTVEYVKKTQK